MSSRPRRSVAAPSRYDPISESSILASASTSTSTPKPNPRKRKADALQGDELVEHLLTNSKSKIATNGLSDLINEDTWCCLSVEARTRLCALLPNDVDFGSCRAEEGQGWHPSMLRVIKSKDAALQRDGANDHKRETSGMEEFEKQIKFLKDPAFQSAARTFQDHLAAGYYAEAHVKKSEKFHTVLKNGTAHVPWKDDVWLETHPDEPNPPTSELGPLQSMTPSSAEASEKITLAVLAKKGVLREGDILSYRRTFRNRTVVVTWDFVLESIHPKSLTFVFAPTPQLPSSIRMPFPAPPEPPLQLLDVQRPSQIENVALDHDGRIEKSQKTATNAWKSFSVWRWTDDFLANIAPHLSDNPELIVGLGDKGGRESCGSLFYLRDSFVKET